ncbi:MAG: hypothetical protein IIC46_10850 [Planctomycetes bacterium]|nr:hypothetical protein [Planctomycetota bacterium]
MTAIRTPLDADHADRSTDFVAQNPSRPTVVPHRMLIGSALTMGFGGLTMSVLGTISGESLFDGVQSAAILMLFALLASFEDRPRLIGRVGYYLGLAAALVFGLNFARLGWKWFEPTNWFALAPPIAFIMGGSGLFSFYKICRARRDYVGAVLAISVTVACVVLSASWNDGQGLIGIDSSYSVALFLVFVGAAIWRFQTALIAFFRQHLSDKMELVPVALIAVIAVAGAIKLTWSVLPQGAMAKVEQLIWATDDVEPSTAPSAASGQAEDVNAPPPSAQVGTPSAAPH